MLKRGLESLAVNSFLALVFGKLLNRASGARLQTGHEVRRLLSPRNTGLLLDGGEGRLTDKESFQNVCVIARVGAGKTSRYIIPNVLDKAKRNCSMVVNDPKGEVFAETSGYMQSRGYEVITINPEDLTRSHRFNPLLEARDDIEIEQIAEILVKAGSGNSEKDQFWDNGAVRLVSVLLKLLARAGESDPSYFTLGNLYYLLQNFGAGGQQLDEFAIRWAYDPTDPDNTDLWDEWNGAITGNANAVASFVLTALTALRAFTNRSMVELTAESSFSLDSLRQRKTIVYFIIPAQHAEYYGFWTSVFFRSVFNACMRQLPSRQDLPIYVLYDEFGHSTIPHFVSVANTIRGYRVSLSIVLQSLSQLDTRYGRDYARSIQGGFNTYLAYSGSDPTTAQFFESIAGKVIQERGQRHDSMNTQRQEFNLLNADEVRRIPSTKAVMVSTNQNPAIIETMPYFESAKFHRLPRRYGPAHLNAAKNQRPIRRVDLE